MNRTIALLRKRIEQFPTTECECEPALVPGRVVEMSVVSEFEQEFDITLPPFLKRVYTEVANGGFGPAWGINPLVHDSLPSVSEWLRLERENWPQGRPPADWPDPLLRFCEIGCNAYYGVAVLDEPGKVYAVDPMVDSGNPTDWLTAQDRSVAEWLHHWAETGQTRPR